MKSVVDVDDRIVVSAVSAQLRDNRANGSKPCPVGSAHVIIIVIQVFGVPTQLVQVSEANRFNVAAVVGQPGEGTDNGSVRGVQTMVPCSAAC